MKTNMQQAPIRNATTIGASVYSHSGEFAPVDTDLQLTGRGLDFKFIRSYRSSLAENIGELGRGWSSSIAKRIEREGDDIIYHDGAGEVYKFAGEKNGNYTSPTGFYGTLLQERNQFLIHQRYGLTYRFEFPEQAGRILGIEDRNHNSIQFSYSADAIAIIDSLNRKIDLSITNGLLQEIKDHAGRIWKYSYDKNDRLIEVTEPETADFPNGTSIRYAYDTNHRLLSITDAKGQKYLVNFYDTAGRVVAQEHGSGMFKMEYDAIGEGENGFLTYRTTCIRKNGSKLVLEHNELGHVLSRTLFAGKESFAPEDITGLSGDDVLLITKSVYNKNSELTSRTFPAGNKTEWVYSEDAEDALNQGNLLQIIERPQTDVESDQTRIVTEYEVEPKFQLTTKLIDPRGNQTLYEHDEQGNLLLTTYPSVTIQPVNGNVPRPPALNRIQTDEYQYNAMGQLLRRKHIDGSITEYHYYPANDPIGRRGPNSATNDFGQLCGYLARVVRDANGRAVKTEYAYDKFGNATTVWDGKNNPARLRYNAMGKLERVTSREPFKNRIDYHYDANYNEIESVQSFERLEYDEQNQKTVVKSSTLRELKEYNALDNLILRKIVGGDKVIAEHFTRDANENIVRQVQPSGNTTEYNYDERDLLVEKKLGTGTRETFSERFTYTLNSAVRTYTDGNGKMTTHHYDGFHRYKGFTNSVGTRKTQWLDEADNIVRVEIDGHESRDRAPLLATKYNFDQWNRVYRVDQAWRDASNGQELGQSKWDGETGIVSTVVEYAENGLLGKVWTESDNVLATEYDGVGRLVKIKDLTGEEFSFAYDENNNPTLMKYLGPEVEGRRCERTIRRSYDALDRLVRQQENEEAPEKFEYNALGHVINYVGKSGIEIHHTDDALGRRVGHAFTITDALNPDKVQKIARRFEYDDNYRLTAYTDTLGNRTAYCYDTHDRQTRVISPNGTIANVEYDANGNIVREVDENNNEINNRYDASNRLVERRSLIKNTDTETVEQFEYDGLNRLVAAIAPDAAIRRTYDSLSRLLTEQQGDHLLRCTHDSTGNLTSLVYPGGEEVHKTYDIRQRVTAVSNQAGQTIANFIYRSNDQIAKLLLGNVIETDFSYNQQDRLEAIEYRRTDNHDLVDGFRYQYDDTGKITHEIQLSEGPTYGERYYYDDANRATKAQYGVQDVFDPNSAFEQETSYEHFPEGSWQRRVDVDGQGQLIDDQSGTINQRNNYQDFGNLAFTYDANGNCIRKGKSNPGYCDYKYDADNRLIKSECYGARGNKTQTIEYTYDTFGRQVRKVVTDMRGRSTEYTYVYAGTILLEEYENGVLVRTYRYGLGSLPVLLSVDNGGRSDYYYIFNGRELASGLVYTRDPYEFAEKYGYELPGASFMKEINGVKVGIPSRKSTISKLVNALLAGDYWKDWANGTHFGIGGKHIAPEIAAMLNTVGHRSVMDILHKQINDQLTMIGHGSRGQEPTGAGSNSGFGSNNKIPVGSNSGFGSNKRGAALAGGPDGLPPGVQLSSRAPNSSLYGFWPMVLFQYFTLNPRLELAREAWERLNAQREKENGPGGSEGARGGPGSDKLFSEEKAAEEAKAKEEKEKKQDEAFKKWQEEKAAEEAKKKEEKKKKGGGMTDPDSGSGGVIALPSLQQIEAKLTQTKTPMNPNGGYVSPGIEPPSSKGPSKRDLISYYDGELSFGGDFGDSTIIPGGGYTTYVRGWVPFTPKFK